MTPAEYVEEIVLPTVRLFLDDPGDRRKGYLAAIVTYHVGDYLRRAGAQPSIKRDFDAGMTSPEYEIVDGICQGTKHCGRDYGAHRFSPGDEHHSGPFGFGPGCSGFDDGRWDQAGLRVEHGGDRFFVDEAVKVVLRAFVAKYPAHLGTVDLDV